LVAQKDTVALAEVKRREERCAAGGGFMVIRSAASQGTAYRPAHEIELS
jgi:hypothetical protein